MADGISCGRVSRNARRATLFGALLNLPTPSSRAGDHPTQPLLGFSAALAPKFPPRGCKADRRHGGCPVADVHPLLSGNFSRRGLGVRFAAGGWVPRIRGISTDGIENARSLVCDMENDRSLACDQFWAPGLREGVGCLVFVECPRLGFAPGWI